MASLYDADSAWHDYDAECRFIERAARPAQASRGATLLDLCCGTGSHALVLARKGHHVTGIDASRRMVDLATRKARESGLARRARFQLGNVLELRSNGRRFDGAYMLGLSALLDFLFGSMLPLCAAVGSLLRPGGFFVFDLHVGTTHPHTPPRGTARYRVGSTLAGLRIREERHPGDGFRIYRYDWTLESGGEKRQVRAWERLRIVRESDLAGLMSALRASGRWGSVELGNTDRFKNGYRVLHLRKRNGGT
ncbi:MAG: methyltransferase domain-containing protein [Nitrospirae bacterium]|nr:methyltransferase domain-containing protein [Nitrospirota bacterium]